MTKRACVAQVCKMISRSRLSDRVAATVPATVPVAISPGHSLRHIRQVVSLTS
mgnify:FL=1